MTAGASATAEGEMLLRRLELRHLRYFMAVAEELSFRGAAAKLHISQPPLTTQIQQLEALLEVQLFERNKQRVLLTAAGRELIGHARRLLDELAGIKSALAHAADGTSGELRIGYTESAVHAGVLLQAMQRVRTQRPRVTWVLRPMASASQFAALENGELDVGFVWTPDPRLAAAFDCEVVRTDFMAAALPRGHALSRHVGPLSLASLAAEPFVMVARDNGTAIFRTVMRFCREAGFVPEVAIEVPDLASVIGLVASGAGVAVIPGVMSRIKGSGIVYRPLADETCRIGLHWISRRGDASPLVAAFRQALIPDPGDGEPLSVPSPARTDAPSSATRRSPWQGPGAR